MRFNKLDLNLLVALDALLTLKNVSRAAERLNVSQSAASNALARLRGYFNDDLLVRVGRRMELTPRAEGLQDPLKDVLLRVEATVDSQPQFNAKKSNRQFRVFLSDYSAMTIMPHVFSLAQRESDSVRFQLLPQDGEPQRALERGEADLLIMPVNFCSREHPLDILLQEKFCCALWRGSRLAKGKLTRDRYLNAGHIVMQPPGIGQLSYEAISVPQVNVTRRIEVSVFSFVGAIAATVGTERIATAHERLATLLELSLPIIRRPLPIPLEPMQQAIQWHKYRSQDPAIQWLRSLFKQAAQTLQSTRAALGAGTFAIGRTAR
jgi:LysR family transcriptional regulator, nod-box dependent transcriptional activator